MIFETTDPAGGILCELRIPCDGWIVHYASATAAGISRFAISLDGELYDVVWAGAGGSHSWWHGTRAGLFATAPKKGQVLRVSVDHGPAAFRLDAE